MRLTGTRRSFLTGVAAGVTYLQSAAASARELAALLAASAGKENYWNLVKQQFPLRHGIIPMNAANLCPSPRAVADRVLELTRDIDGDVSFQSRAKFGAMLEESRRKVAAQLGVEPDEIALVRNTSEANNVINNGLRLKAGDEVVVFDLNHPTNNVAWDVRAARFGFTVKRVGVPRGVADAGEMLQLFEDALTSRTRALAITYVTNNTGIRLPARELCGMARRRGIYTHVDGAQTWGALHLDLRQLGCDSFSASAHKWFMGPKEAGILYVRRERLAELWPGVVGANWGRAVETDLQGARKFESLGQRDDACLAAVGTAVDFHRVIGAERVEARVIELASALKEGLSKIRGANLITPMDPRWSAGVCTVSFSGAETKNVYERIYAKHGIAGANTGGLRLCPHIYNTMEDVEQTIRAVAEAV
jgi:selenocysteine lyase/cysteine desulfurase